MGCYYGLHFTGSNFVLTLCVAFPIRICDYNVGLVFRGKVYDRVYWIGLRPEFRSQDLGLTLWVRFVSQF